MRLWTNLNGTKPVFLLSHSDSVRSINVLADNRIASGACDNNIIVWSNINGAYQASQTLKKHTDCVNGLVSVSDSLVSYLISGSQDQTLNVWKSQSGSIFTLNQNIIMKSAVLTMAAHLSMIASGLSDGTVNVWVFDQDFSTSKSLLGHNDRVLSLSFIYNSSLNRFWLASGSRDTNGNYTLVCFSYFV